MRNARAALLAVVLVAQAPAAKSVLGTVTSFNKDANTLEVKADNASPVPVKLLSNTSVQRIAPGETSLAKATAITVADIAAGDRVLVNLASNGSDALRVVVIAATDIAKRDDADRQDWAKRGISGIVAAKNGNQILLQKQRTPSGEFQPAITVSDKTKFRRYSPDSVKFGDAIAAKLDDVNVGDQIRARGTKSPEGLKVDAEEAVFGTFLTKAGSVVSIDAASREITVKELGTGKPLTIKLTADSSIKQMPNTPADGRNGAPGAANVAQIVDRLPSGNIEDIKPGTSVVVSSTKGATADKVTAILIVANADALIRMAGTPSGRGGTLVFGAGDTGGLSVLGLQ
jgi:hypothetical protein